MPFKLSAPLIKEFHLEKSDENYPSDGIPTTVTIRQATQEQHERRSAIFSEVTRVLRMNAEDPNINLRQTWSVEELKRQEIYLTMVDSNILDENGTPLFRFKKRDGKSFLDMNTEEFRKAFGLLPPDVADEIHEKVLEVNLTWAGPLAN